MGRLTLPGAGPSEALPQPRLTTRKRAHGFRPPPRGGRGTLVSLPGLARPRGSCDWTCQGLLLFQGAGRMAGGITYVSGPMTGPSVLPRSSPPGAGRARWLSGLGVSCAVGAGAVHTEAPVWSSRDVSPRAASNCCAGWTRPQKAAGRGFSGELGAGRSWRAGWAGPSGTRLDLLSQTGHRASYKVRGVQGSAAQLQPSQVGTWPPLIPLLQQ